MLIGLECLVGRLDADLCVREAGLSILERSLMRLQIEPPGSNLTGKISVRG